MIAAIDLGELPYPDYLSLGRALCVARADGRIPDLLLFATHPPVITLGLQSQPDELLWDESQRDVAGLPVIPIERGGATTYHGPDQEMLYPVLGLELGALHQFVANLQGAVVAGCAALGVTAFKREGYPGVWTDKGKLASLGLAIKRKVTLHGIALNCVPCASGGFEAIIPCGLQDITMTSLAQETGFPYPRVAIRAALASGWEMAFGTRVESGSRDLIPADCWPATVATEAIDG